MATCDRIDPYLPGRWAVIAHRSTLESVRGLCVRVAGVLEVGRLGDSLCIWKWCIKEMSEEWKWNTSGFNIGNGFPGAMRSAMVKGSWNPQQKLPQGEGRRAPGPGSL